MDHARQIDSARRQVFEAARQLGVPAMEYQKLLEFCNTGRQREVIQTIIDNNGDQVAAAKVLGITPRGINKTSRLASHRKAPTAEYLTPNDMLRNECPIR